MPPQLAAAHHDCLLVDIRHTHTRTPSVDANATRIRVCEFPIFVTRTRILDVHDERKLPESGKERNGRIRNGKW